MSTHALFIMWMLGVATLLAAVAGDNVSSTTTTLPTQYIPPFYTPGEKVNVVSIFSLEMLPFQRI